MSNKNTRREALKMLSLGSAAGLLGMSPVKAVAKESALWDIKGKRANMPVYQLLGGKSRFAVDCYAHAEGNDPSLVSEKVQELMSKGFRHIRIQQGGYGGTGTNKQIPDFKKAGFGYEND